MSQKKNDKGTGQVVKAAGRVADAEHDAVEQVRELLEAIPADELTGVGVPVAVLLQEGNDLLTTLEVAGTRAALLAVGLAESDVEGLDVALEALRTLQSRWTVLRDRSKDEEQRAREERGAELRAELSAAARWNLRADRSALGTLELIALGDGVADLVQDLSDLAELITTRAAAFASDKTFAVPEQATRARALSAEIREGVSGSKVVDGQVQAKLQRDRALALVDGYLTRIREAGRYAFRNDAKLRARFSSAFLRDKNRKQARPVTNGTAAPSAGAESVAEA